MSRHVLSIAALIMLMALAACAADGSPAGPVGPAGPAGPIGPVGPAGTDASASQGYVGAETCGDCHEEIAARFTLSAHPHALKEIENGQAPQYPYDTVTGGVLDPPDGSTWDEISLVIGGYGWKARFVNQDGYLVAGEPGALTQYNFANETVGADAAWVSGHEAETEDFDCARCHTTGFQAQGHQDNKEGIAGTWAFAGVQCEVCHGPGSLHAADPQGIQMVVDRSAQLCGKCHSRDNPAHIDAQAGFERQYVHYDGLYNSTHFALSCITCHDPHASTLYEDEEVNPTKAISQQCESCHWLEGILQNNRLHRQLGVDCIDCHMPPMGMSAWANLETLTGDLHTHQFSINPDPDAPQFNEDGTQVMPYLTLAYACQHCHNGDRFSVQDEPSLAAVALGYHTRPTPTPLPTPTPEPTLEPTPEPTATPAP